MWRDIALCNRRFLLDALREYQRVLQRLTRALDFEKGPALLTELRRSKGLRDAWLAGQGKGK
jgi:prephenate dehydrogenase